MIDPHDTFIVYLDETLPEAERSAPSQRPALVYRYGTAAERRQHNREVDQLLRADPLEPVDIYEKRASYQLLETANLLGSDEQPLSERLSEQQLRWLADRVSEVRGLSVADRKKSASPSPSPAAASAERATTPAADAAASTRPQR